MIKTRAEFSQPFLANQDLRTWQRRQLVSRGVDPNRVDADAFGTVTAFINESRWVAVCDVCNGGEVVDPADPRFICLSCGQVRAVDFPPPRDRAAIEAALNRRPDEKTRNWNPGETAADLARENAERGID